MRTSDTQLAHLLRTMLCKKKILFKTTCTVMLEFPVLFLCRSKNTSVTFRCFFYDCKLCKFIIQHSLNEEKCCSARRFLLETTPWALWKMYNATPSTHLCTQNWTSLASINLCINGRVRAEMGSADSVPASLLIFSRFGLLFSSIFLTCHVLQYNAIYCLLKHILPQILFIGSTS